jgi:hypothetical protein
MSIIKPLFRKLSRISHIFNLLNHLRGVARIIHGLKWNQVVSALWASQSCSFNSVATRHVSSKVRQPDSTHAMFLVQHSILPHLGIFGLCAVLTADLVVCNPHLSLLKQTWGWRLSDVDGLGLDLNRF